MPPAEVREEPFSQSGSSVDVACTPVDVGPVLRPVDVACMPVDVGPVLRPVDVACVPVDVGPVLGPIDVACMPMDVVRPRVGEYDILFLCTSPSQLPYRWGGCCSLGTISSPGCSGRPSSQGWGQKQTALGWAARTWPGHCVVLGDHTPAPRE